MSAKCAQQKYDLSIPDLLCPKPLQGSHDSTSLYKHTFRKFTILTDQIIHTLKNEFVYFCM